MGAFSRERLSSLPAWVGMGVTQGTAIAYRESEFIGDMLDTRRTCRRACRRRRARVPRWRTRIIGSHPRTARTPSSVRCARQMAPCFTTISAAPCVIPALIASTSGKSTLETNRSKPTQKYLQDQWGGELGRIPSLAAAQVGERRGNGSFSVNTSRPGAAPSD